MMTIVTAHATSTAEPEAFFARWADMATWPDWNLDTEWVRLDGPFQAGSTGQLKPKGGPKVRFVIERLELGREFVDVSMLLGARLVFDHQVAARAEGGCTIDVSVTLSGPLARCWNLLLGKGIAATAGPDLQRLVNLAEQGVRS